MDRQTSRMIEIQWSKLTSHILVMWWMIACLLLYSTVLHVKLANLRSEMNALKARQAQQTQQR